MNIHTRNSRPIGRPAMNCCAAAIASILALAPQATRANETPSDIRSSNGSLCWTSDAQSVNVYRNGVYIGTVHDDTCLDGVDAGAVYRLAAHDRGRNFSPMSDGVIGRARTSDDDDDDDEEEIDWEEARLYFELNNTDGDLGLHMLVDGETWESVELSDARERRLLELKVSGALRAQGMTELFFESDEPTFDELTPADFFARFPEGEYEIEAKTVDGRELEAEIALSHVMPDAPRRVMAGRDLVPEDCEEQEGPRVNGPLTLSWMPVVGSHPTIGRSGAVTLEAYQIVAEREEPPQIQLSIDVDPTVTSVTLPSGLFEGGDEVKIEVLAIADTSSRSATESCFVVGGRR